MAQEKISIYIPEDILSEVLLKLPARSLGKFRCVSKSWLSITSNITFIRSNAQHSRITRHSLFIGDRMLPIAKLYLICAKEKYYESAAIRLYLFQHVKSMPEDIYLLASCDGLLCLSCFNNYRTQYLVINPLTGQFINLPRDGVVLYFNLGFYFHRPTFKYRLIRLRDTMHVNEVLVVGERLWRRISGYLPVFHHCSHPLDLNGSIYWLAHSQDKHQLKVPPDIVVIFDVEEEVYSVISLPPLDKLQDRGGNLMDFNGELGFWVFGKDNGIDVWIMEKHF